MGTCTHVGPCNHVYTSLYPRGRPRGSPWMLVLDQLSFVVCDHLGSKPADVRSFSLCLLFPVTLPFKQSLQLTLLLLLRVHSQGLWTLPRPWLGLLSEGVHLTANRSISKAAAHMCSFGPEPVGAGMTAFEENMRTWRAPGWSCSVHRQKHFFVCQIVHS